MGILKQFSKDTLLYGIGHALKKFIGFLLLPFYTKSLSPSDYGILDSVTTLTMLLSVIFGMSVIDAGSRYYYEQEDDAGKRQILTNVFYFVLATAFPCAIFIMFSSDISYLLFNSDSYSTVVAISLISIPLSLMNDEQSWIFRYFRTPWRYNFYISAKTFLNLGLGICLVVIFNYGLIGAQLASLSSSFIVILVTFIFFTRNLYTFKLELKYLKKMLKFGFPLMLSAITMWIFNSADRFFLLAYQSTSAVGIYSIAAALARPISVLNMAIGMSYYPFLMSLYEKELNPNKPQTKSFIEKIWKLYLLLALIISSFISIFGREIIMLIATPEYATATVAIPVLMFSSIVRLSIDITCVGIFISEKTIHYTWITLIAAALSLLLNLLMVPQLSYLGSALSNLLVNLVYFLIASIISEHYFPMRKKNLRVVIFVLVSVIISVVVPILYSYFQIDVGIYIKLILLMLVVLLPFSLRLVDFHYFKTLLGRA